MPELNPGTLSKIGKAPPMLNLIGKNHTILPFLLGGGSVVTGDEGEGFPSVPLYLEERDDPPAATAPRDDPASPITDRGGSLR